MGPRDRHHLFELDRFRLSSPSEEARCPVVLTTAQLAHVPRATGPSHGAQRIGVSELRPRAVAYSRSRAHYLLEPQPRWTLRSVSEC